MKRSGVSIRTRTRATNKTTDANNERKESGSVKRKRKRLLIVTTKRIQKYVTIGVAVISNQGELFLVNARISEKNTKDTTGTSGKPIGN